MKKLIKNIGLIISLILISALSTSFSCKTNIGNCSFQKNEDIKIEGLYILKSCENSRFKININKTNNFYMFFILDGKKQISKGKVFIRKEDDETIITFGEICGVFQGKDILVQNHGDAVNHYIHFIQCGQKFILFEKQ